MKCNSIFTILLFIQYTCAAQYDNANKSDSNRVSDAKYILYDLKTENKSNKVQLPFGEIVFKDVRYDTSYTAINWIWKTSAFSTTFNRKYNLTGGVAASLTSYFKNFYSTAAASSNNGLTCYIKKFSIGLKDELLEHFNAGSQFTDDNENKVHTEIECYYHAGDSLYPAVRLNTSYSHLFRRGAAAFTGAVKEIIEPLMYKIEHLNPGNIVKRKSYTFNQIEKRYGDRFNLSILNSSNYKKGIYKSFTEFRNNAPSIDSFIISTDKLKVNAGDINMIDATSLLTKAIQKRNTAVFLYDKYHELISPSEVFGYCDGTTIWIAHGSFFYPLVKTGNSFEFIYSYHFADANRRTQTIYILLPLNMETGYSD